MKSILFILFIAVATLGTTSASAQSYHYGKVQQNFSYSDGFGIDHAKTIEKSGDIKIEGTVVTIDGVTYTSDDKGVFRNSDGKKVKIVYGYTYSNHLGAISVIKGNTITEYLLEKPATAEVANR